tara:strand:+ start:2289 stop:4022 length:1734 start_codon:yes stop_codon:yes gene_type:complete
MKKILVLFIPKEEWEDKHTLDQYDEVIEVQDFPSYIKNNPLAWENHFRDFTSTEVNGKKVLNYFQLAANLNVWFYNKFKIFYDNREAFYEIKYLKSFINEKDQIHVVSKYLDQSIFISDKINVLKVASVVKPKNKLLTILKYALIFIFRAFISNKSSVSKKETILFFQLASERKIASKFNPEENKILNGYWSYLEEEFGDEFGYIEDLPFPSLIKPFELNARMFQIKHKNSYTTEYIIFNSLFSKKVRNLIKTSISTIWSDLYEVKNQLKEPEDFLIINHCIRLRSITSLYLRKYYSFEVFFKKTKNIQSILAYGENLSQSKVILDSAKSSDIKTFGLQHGIIRPYNVGYNLSKLEASIHPMPDITIVWGEYWKEQLIENANYRPETIKVVGQPRTDIIPIIMEKYRKNPKLVTFFSQLQPDLQEKFYSAESFVKVSKLHPELQFEIKLHPAETDDIYSKLIEKEGSTNIRINLEKDTFQLLAESALIMTCFSTVGAEALCFNKPLITFDSQGRDIAGYISNKIAYWVQNEAELNMVVTKFKDGTLEPIETKSYVEKTFSKIDGKTNLRIKNIILEK